MRLIREKELTYLGDVPSSNSSSSLSHLSRLSSEFSFIVPLEVLTFSPVHVGHLKLVFFE